jgi:nucleoside-diphosphate-sugar epimerase
LITGGAGFVGVNIAAALAAGEGRYVIVGDLASNEADTIRFLAPVAAQITLATLDVCNREALRDLIRREAVTHIVHAAAITATAKEESGRAGEIVDVNLGGAVNVLAVAAEEPAVERVVMISSSGLYGAPSRPATQRRHETDPLNLGNLYAITKYSAELLAARYAVLSGKPMASLRLPAVYGPMERARSSRPATSAIRQLMDALQQRRSITVSGAEVAQDWTYAADVGAAVDALLAAPHWHWNVYNAGCGQAYRFSRVVAAFAAFGLQAAWVETGDVADVSMRLSQERTPLDIERLRSDTGYTPHYNLEAGLAHWLRMESLA